MFDKERFEKALYYTILMVLWIVAIGCMVTLVVLLDIWFIVLIVLATIFIISVVVYIILTVKERRN